MHVGCSDVKIFIRRLIAVLVPAMYVGCSGNFPEQLLRLLGVLVPAMYVGCSVSRYGRKFDKFVLVPAMYVGCSSEICTKAVSLCSYFITMCCICQVLFPINFRFFILFFCSICFSSNFLVRIPLFHPSNRCENRDFRGTIFIYYFLI